MLYLVQHGEAVAKEVNPDRPLSSQGEEDIQRMGDFMKRAGVTVDRVIHSGKTRAKQSAEILAQAVSESGATEAVEGINPNDSATDFSGQLQQYNTPTMIVGHLPFMAKLVAYLVAGSDDTAVVNYQPGSVVCLQQDEKFRWQINWMIRPALIR